MKKGVKLSRERTVVLYRVLRESKHRILLFELTGNLECESGLRKKSRIYGVSLVRGEWNEWS